MAQRVADRNLLFGILAVQRDFISADQLVAALDAWVQDRTRPLGQILLEQGALPAPRRAQLEALVEEHLKRHADPGTSLTAVGPQSAEEVGLRVAAPPDLQATLSTLAGPHPPMGSVPGEASAPRVSPSGG